MPYGVPRLKADKLLPPRRMPLSAARARVSLRHTGFPSPGVSVVAWTRAGVVAKSSWSAELLSAQPGLLLLAASLLSGVQVTEMVL